MELKKIALGAALLAAAFATCAQSAQRKPYIVQISAAPAAAYEGGVAGLTATRPAAGQRLNVQEATVQAYLRHVNTKVAGVAAAVPAAHVYHRYGVAFSGFAAMLTPAELAKLAKTPGVLAIQADEAMPLDTSYTTSSFLGLGAEGGAWSRTDSAGRALKGEGVIIAMVDGGIWPENVSVSDKVDPVTGKPVPSHAAGTVVYDPLPAGRYKGSCQAGEAFTAAMCNNKLIGAQNFNATLKVVNPVLVNEYDSPRDGGGHGTHTLTTAGGNANSDVSIFGSQFTISGVAPRARLAAYKVCNQQVRSDGTIGGSCFTGDSMAAIDKAVADGVDVINFSIAGDGFSVAGLVAQAMRGAAKAGVFVSASAGNSGPGNTLAHISPWVSTVGNSTHDRFSEATVRLVGAPGNGYSATGPSFQSGGLPATPLILSTAAGLPGVDPNNTQLKQCFGPADGVASLLDPAKVAGKILVCYRGGNAFVNKAINAKEAGAVGYVAQNVAIATPTSATSLFLISAVIPMVHLQTTHEAQVFAHAAAGGTASFSGGVQVAGVAAPVMASSSSRGPNRGDVNVLKPDITGPGTDIIAAYIPEDLTVADRAALIAGTATGRQGASMISGTSMSAPHVAGAAALLKQLNPTWSPSAIKSALMTSAQPVKLASGAVDTNRWGYGAGHLNPNGALSTSVIYDITSAQYDAYNAGTLSGTALNMASITAANVVGTSTVTRRLTNGGANPVTLSVTSTVPAGFTVVVNPTTLTLAAGATASYSVTITRTDAPFNTYRFGSLTWAGSGQTVVSPLTVRSTSLVAQTTVDDTRASGSRIVTVATGYNGALVTTPSGMLPATRTNGNVVRKAEACSSRVVPAGTQVLRAQLFNSETQEGAATDLDLRVYTVGADNVRTLVATSGNGDTNELVSMTNPAAGNYQVCVFADGTVGESANYVLNTWLLGAPTGQQTLKAAGPSKAFQGGMASIVASWSLAPGARYLGRVVYSQTVGGAAMGGTTVFVDATANAQAVAAEAAVLRNKPLN